MADLQPSWNLIERARAWTGGGSDAVRRRLALALVAALQFVGVEVGAVSVVYAGLTIAAVAVLLALWQDAADRRHDTPSDLASDPGEGDARDAGAMVAAAQRELATLIWRQAVAAMPDPAMIADAAGQILNVNAPLRELMPKAAEGLPVSRVIRNPDLLRAVEEVRAHGGRVSVGFEDRVPVRRKLLAIVTSLGPARDPSGAAIALVVRDVSEEERLAQMRADFIANASHELRTPLASLRGFVETLQGPARNDEQARERFLAIMATQAARMTRLIDDLLSLSRIEMRAHVPPRGEVDLNDVAAFVVQSLEPVANTLDVSVSLETAPRPAIVRGERDELVQVVQNLLHNAIKYGREGGRVAVRVADEVGPGPQPRRIELSVSDDGPGIAAEHLPRLTERFYRVNPALSRDKGGTGLGLAIVKNILNRHRGELRITSELGHGSTFTAILERLEGPRATAHKPVEIQPQVT